MNNDKSDANGSVYFRKERNRWMAKYSVKDYTTGKMVVRRKSFLTEEDAQNFLKTLEFQKKILYLLKIMVFPLLKF